MRGTVEEMAVAIPVVTAMAEEGKTAAKVMEMVAVMTMETMAAKVTTAAMPQATVVDAVAVTITAMVVERGEDGAARMVGAAAELVMEGRAEAAARAEEVLRGVVVRGAVPAEERPEEPATLMLGRLAVREEPPTSEVAKIGEPVV